ncbi:hypothetical protein SRHO_G00188410 [Serrasalmus rhombeus]
MHLASAQHFIFISKRCCWIQRQEKINPFFEWIIPRNYLPDPAIVLRFRSNYAGATFSLLRLKAAARCGGAFRPVVGSSGAWAVTALQAGEETRKTRQHRLCDQ